VTVTFALPGSGASGTLSGGNTGVTDANGQVTKTLTANATAGTYSITVTASGGSNPSATISNLTNTAIATPPTDIHLSNASINENQPAGTVVGTFSTTDPDSGDSHTYTLVAGTGDADNASFTIDASGNLKTAAVFDFEAKSSYSIRVRSTDSDGLWTEKVFTVGVVDLPELIGSPIVGDGTAQRSFVNQITLTFDGEINIAYGAFSLVKRGPGGGAVTLQAPEITQSGGQTLVTLRFAGSFTRGPFAALLDGYYQLTIDGTKITRSGRQLDANGDGVEGDEYDFGDDELDKFFALYGDTNGDGLVGIAEYSQFRATYGKLPTDIGYDIRFDYDGSGVGNSDFVEFRNRFGKPKLPWV
jgi:hypothetical protein